MRIGPWFADPVMEICSAHVLVARCTPPKTEQEEKGLQETVEHVRKRMRIPRFVKPLPLSQRAWNRYVGPTWNRFMGQ